MKVKFWERTAFRVVIFFLCAIFLVGAVCLMLVGEKQFSDLQRENDFSFHISDVFRARDFLESETFSGFATNDIWALIYLYNNYAENGGVRVTNGEGYEREVKEHIGYIYDQIRDYISGNIIYEENPELSYEDEAYDSQYEYDEMEPPRAVPDSGILPGQDESTGESYRYVGERVIHYSDPHYDIVFDFETIKIFGDQAFVQNGMLKYYDEEGVGEAFEKLFPEQITQIRQIIADMRQETYDDSVKKLAGVLYFVGDGDKILSNVELDANGNPKDLDELMGSRAWFKIDNMKAASNVSSLANSRWSDEIGKAVFYAAWQDEAISAKESLYHEANGLAQGYFFTAIALAVLAIVLFVMLIVYTGRKRPSYENTRKLWAFDKIFVEFQIILLVVLTLIGAGLTGGFLGASSLYESVEYGLYVGFAGAAALVFVLAFLWFALSLVRVGKAGLFAERSLIAVFARGPARALGNAIKSGYDGRNPLAKTILVVILFWFLTALFSGICGVALRSYGFGVALLVCGVLLLLTLAGAIHFTYKWVERYGRLRKGVAEIGIGNLGYKIEIKGDGKNEFDRLSALVNELGSAQNTAIQNELKNQRLKTDLISNVSHDLKTPLTSIITYTDLLKTEGLKSKNAEEYLNVIDEKGKRLQKLTEDLFDAAKASSGAITVRKEKVDMLALIRQEIAEMNGSFDKAELELVIETEKEHYYVEADSQLLWRVVDNLLRNARKYAQPGTRIYIELKEYVSKRGGAATQGGAPLMTTLEIKNTSAVKLNIPPEELMERFKRGDESRASEGSGLGLAIAKDLVHLQDGWFELSIDGDLFKAIVMLPPYTGEE